MRMSIGSMLVFVLGAAAGISHRYFYAAVALLQVLLRVLLRVLLETDALLQLEAATTAVEGEARQKQEIRDAAQVTSPPEPETLNPRPYTLHPTP